VYLRRADRWNRRRRGLAEALDFTAESAAFPEGVRFERGKFRFRGDRALGDREFHNGTALAALEETATISLAFSVVERL
jgi:hypothetical protein